MRRIRFLQAFVIMMFALVFAGKGNVFAAEGEILVEVEVDGGSSHEMGNSGDNTIDGLTWDGSKNELTLNNYDGGYIHVYSTSTDLKKCTVKVIGKNTIQTTNSEEVLTFKAIDATFVGDGTIDMIMSHSEGDYTYSYFEQENGGSITINGPTINLKNSTGTLVTDSFYMKSGALNIERVPCIYMDSSGTYFSYYDSICANNSFIVEGGTISIEYVYPQGYENVHTGFETSCAIHLRSPKLAYLGVGNIDFKVADELKDQVTLTEKESVISFEFADKEGVYTELDGVEGLSYDAEHHVLTMDGYHGGGIYITSDLMVEGIDVVVKGNNIIDNAYVSGTYQSIYASHVNLNFTGTGSLTIDNKESSNIGRIIYTDFEQKYDGVIKIDGPTINIVGNNSNPINVNRFIMNSGYLTIELAKEESGSYLAAIYAFRGIEINGGIITVKYLGDGTGADPAILCNKYDYEEESLIPASANDCIVVLIANEQIYEDIEPFAYHYSGMMDCAEPTFEVGDGVVVVRATSLDDGKIDISKFKASLSETKFTYDGKEKTPTVSVTNLVEDRDFTVKYVNNINPGKASAVVTGKGMFTGEIKLDFIIEGENKEGENGSEEYGPAEGSKIKDKKYNYEVIKAGSIDGKVVGELKVTGLKKKSLTQIKVAAVVTINGVKYKVTSIGAKAFKGNKKITKATIGKNVKEIGANAFAKCPKLKQVTINSTVLKTIGKSAFNGDKKLTKVIIKSTKLKKVGKKAFARKGGKKLTFRVPKSKKKAYKKILKSAKTNKFVVK